MAGQSGTAMVVRSAGRWAGGHPGGAVLILLAALWLVGHRPWLAAGFGAAVFAGPIAFEAAAGWWWAQPWQVRYGLAAVSAVAGYVASLARWLAVALAAAVVAAGMWAAARWARGREHYRTFVEPLHEALAPVVGLPLATRPKAYLHVPPGLLDGPGGVYVTLPRGALPDEKKRAAVVTAVTTKLGLNSERTRVEWRLSGRSRHVHFAWREKSVPARAAWADEDTRKAIEAASKPGRPVLGLTNGDRAVAHSLISDSPHWLLSMSTGGGKSGLLKAIIAQELHHGSLVTMLDFKRHSHPWLRKVPDVEYLREIEDIHSALVNLAAMAHKRDRQADDAETPPKFTRHVIVLEELNVTMRKLTRFWERTRESDEPKRSPALDALEDLLQMGRAVAVHIVTCGQLATARAIGGPEARECFHLRVLGRASAKAWRMLAEQITPIPKVGLDQPGRVHVVVGARCDEVQVLWLTDEEAIDYATSGRRPPAAVPTSHPPVAQGKQGGHVLGQPALAVVDGGQDGTPEPAGVRLSRLSADKGDGSVAESLAVLRRESTRDPEFPKPTVVGGDGKPNLYDRDAVARWSRNRPNGGRAVQ